MVETSCEINGYTCVIGSAVYFVRKGNIIKMKTSKESALSLN